MITSFNNLLIIRNSFQEGVLILQWPGELAMGAGTFLKRVGKKGIGAVATFFLLCPPPLLSSLPTLDRVLWVGKKASLPTQITKRKARIV